MDQEQKTDWLSPVNSRCEPLICSSTKLVLGQYGHKFAQRTILTMSWGIHGECVLVVE